MKSRGREKKACILCGHGITIHGVVPRAATVSAKRTHPCNHPGCKCRDYKPKKL